MGFSIQFGIGHVAMVSGTDVDGKTGTMVLDTTQWDFVQDRLQDKQDLADFNQAVLDWAAPVMEAVEAIEERRATVGPVDKIVIEEGVEPVKARPEFAIEPDINTTIITLVVEDRTDLLRWMTDTQLLVLR